jgi:glycerol uptake facilitator-like aquaporin
MRRRTELFEGHKPQFNRQLLLAIIGGNIFSTDLQAPFTKTLLLKIQTDFHIFLFTPCSLSKYVTSGWHAFLLEAFGTAFLVFCIFMLTNKKNSVPSAAVPPLVAIAIGSMVVLLGPMTGAGINPARDMGPRLATLVAGWRTAAFANWIVYFTAPLVGGPIGALIADRLLMA